MTGGIGCPAGAVLGGGYGVAAGFAVGLPYSIYVGLRDEVMTVPGTWSAGDVQALLRSEERLEVAFPVRYPLGPLPFGMLLRGCVLALTDRDAVAFAYTKASSRPGTELWREPRGGTAVAEPASDRGRLTFTRPSERHTFVVSARYRHEMERFVEAFSPGA